MNSNTRDHVPVVVPSPLWRSPAGRRCRRTTYLLVGCGGPRRRQRSHVAHSATSMRTTPRRATRARPSLAVQIAAADVVVTLVQDAVERAGITAPAVSAAAVVGRAHPGCRRAQRLQTGRRDAACQRPDHAGARGPRPARAAGADAAQIFSPELADAQTRLPSARRSSTRTSGSSLDRRSSSAIGAASRQELERLHAEHAAKLAGVQSLRSRLVLLGLPAPAIDAWSPGKDIEATTDIPAPIDGVVTERVANVGLNVDRDETLHRRRSVVGLGGRRTVREGLLARPRRQPGHRHDHCLSRPGAAGTGQLHRSAGQRGDADARVASKCRIRATSSGSACMPTSSSPRRRTTAS